MGSGQCGLGGVVRAAGRLCSCAVPGTPEAPPAEAGRLSVQPVRIVLGPFCGPQMCCSCDAPRGTVGAPVGPAGSGHADGLRMGCASAVPVAAGSSSPSNTHDEKQVQRRLAGVCPPPVVGVDPGAEGGEGAHPRADFPRIPAFRALGAAPGRGAQSSADRQIWASLGCSAEARAASPPALSSWAQHRETLNLRV